MQRHAELRLAALLASAVTQGSCSADSVSLYLEETSGRLRGIPRSRALQHRRTLTLQLATGRQETFSKYGYQQNTRSMQNSCRLYQGTRQTYRTFLHSRPQERSMSLFKCAYVCVSVDMRVYTYTCIYVCMYVCTYVCMYVKYAHTLVYIC